MRVRSSGSVLLTATLQTMCGGSTSPTQLSATPLPQACRTYATQWTENSTFGAPTTSSAAYSTGDHVYIEHSPANSGPIVQRTTYASDADFIDEPSVMGRALYIQRATCGGLSNCAGGLFSVETPSYDSRRRQTGLLLQLNGAALLSETYTDWDGLGRPMAGSRTQLPALCTLHIVFTYDDTAHTRSILPSGQGSGPLCLGILTSTIRTYNSDGDLISETDTGGGTSTTTTNSVTATSRLCK